MVIPWLIMISLRGTKVVLLGSLWIIYLFYLLDFRCRSTLDSLDADDGDDVICLTTTVTNENINGNKILC